MVEKKLYVHFEKSNYINSKSELLKVQIEILHLRKLIKSFSLIREKKRYYKEMLEEVVLFLKEKIAKLDLLMPIEKKSLQFIQEKKIKTERCEIKEQEQIARKDNIEDELLKIKQKLDSLNRI